MKLAGDLTRTEIKQIIRDAVRQTRSIAKGIGDDMIGQIEMLVENAMSKADIERVARAWIADSVDSVNIGKLDRPSDARALVSQMLSGRHGAQGVQKMYDAGIDSKTGDDDIQKIIKIGELEDKTFAGELKRSRRNPKSFI